ncbi:15755_t:CDS:2 [Cetraspora pellucida]|uniref:15755_t:CDS:1 n=1 Tax=Cetraspora pellucida TaxID=1433469 RepID=A0A9N9GVN4_9GLOM|nr:15755_t:CDS:2 [Cetraspora pellucida]
MFGSLFANSESDRNSNEDDNEDEQVPKYLPSKLGSRIKLKNNRQSHIDLEPAMQGFPAKYKK